MPPPNILCTGIAAALFALMSHAELLVYDGIPTSETPGTGTAYSAAELKNGGKAQNPTHTSIVGETGAWNGSDTGTIKANTATNLFYPASVNLDSVGGVVDLTSGGNAGDKTYRTLSRALSPTLAGKSFFATVLVAYNDLSAYPAGAFGGWCLARTLPTNTSFPTAADSVTLGFRKDAASETTGVSAVLRVAGAFHVIRHDVEPGTHLFALRFQYSDTGTEIVSAALLDDSAEPSLAGGEWYVSTTNEVLSAQQSFNWVGIGYNYYIVSQNIYVDEWRIGTEWRDVAGDTPGISCVVNAGAAFGVNASVTGIVTKIDAPGTTVRVYYGCVDGTDDPDEWDAWHEFEDPADVDGQTFVFAPGNFIPNTNYFFRFAASTPTGETFAPWTSSFNTHEVVPVEFSPASMSGVTRSGAILNGGITAGYPVVAVTACLDTVDHGADSLPGNWAKTVAVGNHENSVAFTAAFTDLIACTDYVARFYGTNICGDAWSEAVRFTTLPPAITITDSYFKKGAQGIVTEMSVPVTLDVASGLPVSFRYYTVQATEAKCENAFPDVHYVNETNTVVIPPGATQANLTVRIIGNNDVEFPGKRFYVKYDLVSGAANTPGTTEIGTLCDNLGHRIFFDDFSGGTEKWTPSDTGWTIQSARYRCSGGTRDTRAGATGMKEYGFRVMCAPTVSTSWQTWGIGVYDRRTAGEGSGYRFRIKDSGGSTATSGELTVNGVQATTPTGNLSGSRLGWSNVMRPLAMRVSKTPDGHNRVQCWAGYYKAVDYIDESGALLDGGQITLLNSAWHVLLWDDAEVFKDATGTTIILIR